MVQAHDETLTSSEQRVVAMLLGDPLAAATQPAAQVAETIGVHESTVTRVARKLGYRAYAEMRADLGRDAQGHSGSAVRARNRAVKAHELSRLVDDEIRALSTIPDHVDQAEMDSVALALVRARRIFLFGVNHATTLVEFMERRLRRFGLEVVALRQPGRDLAERMLTFDHDDVLLAFAFKEQPAGLGHALRQTHAAGATSILVTDPPGMLMRPAPTHLIAAPRGAGDDFNTLVVPLVLCYALQLAITNLDPDRFGAAMDRADSLARIYSGDPIDDSETQTRGRA